MLDALVATRRNVSSPATRRRCRRRSAAFAPRGPRRSPGGRDRRGGRARAAAGSIWRPPATWPGCCAWRRPCVPITWWSASWPAPRRASWCWSPTRGQNGHLAGDAGPHRRPRRSAGSARWPRSGLGATGDRRGAGRERVRSRTFTSSRPDGGARIIEIGEPRATGAELAARRRALALQRRREARSGERTAAGPGRLGAARRGAGGGGQPAAVRARRQVGRAGSGIGPSQARGRARRGVLRSLPRRHRAPAGRPDPGRARRPRPTTSRAPRRRSGAPLPDDYASFLRSFDGADLFHESVADRGRRRAARRAPLDGAARRIAPGELVFAEALSGDRFALDADGRVLRYDAGRRRARAGRARPSLAGWTRPWRASRSCSAPTASTRPTCSILRARRSPRRSRCARPSARSRSIPAPRTPSTRAGSRCARLGRRDAALAAFARARPSSTPDNPWPWFDLGRTALALGQARRRAARLPPRGGGRRARPPTGGAPAGLGGPRGGRGGRRRGGRGAARRGARARPAAARRPLARGRPPATTPTTRRAPRRSRCWRPSRRATPLPRRLPVILTRRPSRLAPLPASRGEGPDRSPVSRLRRGSRRGPRLADRGFADRDELAGVVLAAQHGRDRRVPAGTVTLTPARGRLRRSRAAGARPPRPRRRRGPRPCARSPRAPATDSTRAAPSPVSMRISARNR